MSFLAGTWDRSAVKILLLLMLLRNHLPSVETQILNCPLLIISLDLSSSICKMEQLYLSLQVCVRIKRGTIGTCPVLLKTLKVSKEKGSMGCCHIQEAKEDRITKYDVIWVGHRAGERHQGKLSKLESSLDFS